MERNRRHTIRVLKSRFGETTTDALVDFVHLTLKDNNESMYNAHLKNLATKQELKEEIANLATKQELKDEVAKLATKQEFKDEVAKLATKQEFKDEIAKLATKEELTKLEFSTKEAILKLQLSTKEELAKIANKEADILRWMFALFLTMMLALLGLYLKK